jgi:integral membrane protein
MSHFFTSAFGRFRLVSLLEGLSFLLLVGLAMPLKYLAGEPLMVTIMGRAHGGLFVLFMVALVHAAVEEGWTWRALIAFLASLVPFGAFALEWYFRKEEAETVAEVSGG